LEGECGSGIRETRLVERALRERWPIPEALRGPLIDRLSKIVTDPAASPREATAAARAILSASKINLDLIGAAIKAREHEDRCRADDIDVTKLTDEELQELIRQRHPRE
jgi:hypothetical protein